MWRLAPSPSMPLLPSGVVAGTAAWARGLVRHGEGRPVVLRARPGEDDMVKLMVFVGSTVGGYVGWWLGERFGFMTAFMLSMVGTGVGMYYGARFARDRFG